MTICAGAPAAVRRLALAAFAAAAGAAAAPALAGPLEGYYYPAPGSHESYAPRTEVRADASRHGRILFATLMMQLVLERPHAPSFAVSAVDEEATTLVIVGLQDGRYDTLYRARGLFALLTAVARLTPAFDDTPDAGEIEDTRNFFDLVNMLGFKKVVVTNGVKFAHEVTIE